MAVEGSSMCGNERASGSETTSIGPADGEAPERRNRNVMRVLVVRMSLGIVLTAPNV